MPLQLKSAVEKRIGVPTHGLQLGTRYYRPTCARLESCVRHAAQAKKALKFGRQTPKTGACVYNKTVFAQPGLIPARVGGDHLDDGAQETVNKTLLTIGLVLVASVAYAGPKWRVTRVRPNLWGGMQIEQHDSDGNHRSIRMKPNWFGGSTIIEQSN